MKATKTDKGQKSISSFFFKPKGSDPKANQSKPQQQQKQHRVLGQKQAAQGPPPLAAPAKKQRLSEPAEIETIDDEEGPSASAHNSSAHVGVQDLHSVNGHDTSLISTADIHGVQQQIPSRIGHRHQRFQQKLVVGAGNKAEANVRGTAAVTKPKYTPLELQIVELKDKHPGILLIVEVCSSTSCLFCILMQLVVLT